MKNLVTASLAASVSLYAIAAQADSSGGGGAGKVNVQDISVTSYAQSSSGAGQPMPQDVIAYEPVPNGGGAVPQATDGGPIAAGLAAIIAVGANQGDTSSGGGGVQYFDDQDRAYDSSGGNNWEPPRRAHDSSGGAGLIAAGQGIAVPTVQSSSGGVIYDDPTGGTYPVSQAHNLGGGAVPQTVTGFHPFAGAALGPIAAGGIGGDPSTGGGAVPQPLAQDMFLKLGPINSAPGGGVDVAAPGLAYPPPRPIPVPIPLAAAPGGSGIIISSVNAEGEDRLTENVGKGGDGQMQYIVLDMSDLIVSENPPPIYDDPTGGTYPISQSVGGTGGSGGLDRLTENVSAIGEDPKWDFPISTPPPIVSNDSTGAGGEDWKWDAAPQATTLPPPPAQPVAYTPPPIVSNDSTGGGVILSAPTAAIDIGVAKPVPYVAGSSFDQQNESRSFGGGGSPRGDDGGSDAAGVF